MTTALISAISPTPTPSASASAGESVAATVGKVVAWPFIVLLIVVSAVVIRWLINRIIDRTVVHLADNSVSRRLSATSNAVGVHDSEEMAERLRQRARTVAGVLKSITTLVVFGFAFVAILATLGVNVGPLILSAGVIGIALGFGAQSLVKDFLTGVFMILEDQYAVGDFVDTGEAIGTVEEVGLRLTRLRDDQGVIWYVPHGSISRIGNRSQGFGLAVVDVPLAYGADVERASEAIRAAVLTLAEDPAWASDILDEPPTVAVESMTATAVHLQVRQRTRPLRGLPVSRALRERVLQALDEAGVGRPAVSGAGGSPLLDPDPDAVDPAAGST
ncbi:MAG TPA: mechanosensitive ion channel family protein [Candidatus Limnocylindria bacterium]|nr:mechanosensitive ion channel family protein [Candidatus Limnocylindria bacterium]